MSKVIIIEDSLGYLKRMEEMLKAHGWETAGAISITSAKPIIEKADVNDVILSDMRLPEGDADKVLAWMGKMGLHNPVVIMTQYYEAPFAVRMMRLGVKTFIAKDAAIDMHLLEILSEIKKEQRIKAIGNKPIFTRQSEAYQRVVEEAKRVAKIGMNVLLVGESGTGKEHIAALIHNESPRADMPFEKLDAGTLSAETASDEMFGHNKDAYEGAKDKNGRFELAYGGTLFIDEIGNMKVEVQQQLLRVLESKMYRPIGDIRDRAADVRIISATNVDLSKAIEEGRFKRDLLNRIGEYVIKIPPLRETPEDIFPLAEFFLGMAREEHECKAKRFNAAARKALQTHQWIDNVRELRNVVYSAAVRCKGEVITEDDIEFMPFDAAKEDKLMFPSGKITEEDVRKAYKQARGVKATMAVILHVSRGTVHNLLKKYDIEDIRH